MAANAHKSPEEACVQEWMTMTFFWTPNKFQFELQPHPAMIPKHATKTELALDFCSTHGACGLLKMQTHT
jgi:hypothetical protein